MNKVNLSKFIRPDIAEMEEYIPVSSLWDLSKKFNQPIEKVIKLDAGENTYGFSPKVAELLKMASCFNYYPDPEYKELRKALSKYTGKSVENIIVSSGSDELLDLLLRLVLNAKDKVINCPPTFGMYAVLTTLNRGVIVSVPRNKDFSLNIAKIKEKIDDKVKVIFICSPNNPTGTVTSEKEIIRLLKTGKLVVVDEAYYEFCGKTAASLLQEYDNLIILRTFSKWAGIAGLRLGYGMMSSFLIRQLLKFKPPYNVNLAADIAGKATLKDLRTSRKIIQNIVKERNRVKKELDKLSYLTVYPSEANLLFMKVKTDLLKVRNFLEEKKIAVRYYNSDLTGQAIRLSIGKPEQNNKVIDALIEFQAKKINGDSLIFDMDGVLVDVSNSYRQTIKKTVDYVLKDNYGIKVTVESWDIVAMKKIPGFNNDWDLSFELIRLLSEGINRKDFFKKARLVTNQNSKEYKLIKDIFQSYYLGTKIFYEVYRRKTPINFSKGLITNENLLIDFNILKSLSQKYKLGVATSRPRFEALFTLRNLKVTPQIIKEEFIVAQEDAKKEKPAPDPLLEAKRRMKVKKPLYIGDSINDTMASQKAKMRCLYVGKDKLGDIQITEVNQIKKVLL